MALKFLASFVTIRNLSISGTMVFSISFVEKNGKVEAFKFDTGSLMVKEEYMQEMGSAYAKPWTPTKVDLMKLTQEDLKVLLSRGGMRITNRPSKNDLADAILQKWETIKERVADKIAQEKQSPFAKLYFSNLMEKRWEGIVQTLRRNAMRDYINDIKNSESETESTDDVSAVGAEEGGEEEDAQTDDPCVSHVSEAETDEDEEQEEEEEEEEDEESEQDAEPDTKEKSPKVEHMDVWTSICP